MEYNTYHDVGRFYDFGNDGSTISPDIGFFQNLTKPGESILEVGCGTGRVAIELAKNGRKVVGIDLSDSMLNEFRNKIARDSVSGVRFEKQNMTNLRLDESFDWIIFPFRSFQALTTDGDRINCLNSSKQVLNPNGKIVLTLFNPNELALNEWGKKGILDFEKHDESSMLSVSRYQNQIAHDRAAQTITAQYIYKVSENGRYQEIEDWINLGYLFRHQCAKLFENAGLAILAEYGFYDCRPISDSEKKELIFILQSSK